MATRVLDEDGNEIHLYDWVGFKDGIEQSGRVVGFHNGQVIVEQADDVTGDNERRTLNPRKVWLES